MGCVMMGTEGDDVLVGTAGDDVICGLGGADTIDAGDGDDVVFGGTGADIIRGGPGNDELHGNENPDEIHGEAGDDWLGGGKGPDELNGGDGDDTLEGKKGDDLLIGGPGIDTADGNQGTDTCTAETEASCEEDPSKPTRVTFTLPVDGATVFSVETIIVTWEAVFRTSVNLLTNPGFETGDLSGWTTFGSEAVFETVTAPVHGGGFAASIDVFGATPPEFTQTVQVAAGEPHFASVWFNRYNAGGAQVALQVTQPDGTVIAQDTATVFSAGWQRLGVTFTAPSDTVQFRMVLPSFFGEDTVVALDDATLTTGATAELTNPDLDDGYGLPGWTPIGTASGTVRVVEDTGPGDLAVEIRPEMTSDVGVEQSFDAFRYYSADIDARVMFGTDATVLIEMVRPDGSIAATDSLSINWADGWVGVGAGWPDYTEDILTFRVSVINSPGVAVWFDNAGLYQST